MRANLINYESGVIMLSSKKFLKNNTFYFYYGWSYFYFSADYLYCNGILKKNLMSLGAA